MFCGHEEGHLQFPWKSWGCFRFEHRGLNFSETCFQIHETIKKSLLKGTLERSTAVLDDPIVGVKDIHKLGSLGTEIGFLIKTTSPCFVSPNNISWNSKFHHETSNLLFNTFYNFFDNVMNVYMKFS